MDKAPDSQFVSRFAADLDALVAPGPRLGVAVSGGPDSLALLLLAAAARPGLIEAATVDHAMRPESRAEAEMVDAVCKQIGVSHSILTLRWASPPKSNLQARAREQLDAVQDLLLKLNWQGFPIIHWNPIFPNWFVPDTG